MRKQYSDNKKISLTLFEEPIRQILSIQNKGSFMPTITDLPCKIKKTLFIQELQPSLNVNVGSERLLLY